MKNISFSPPEIWQSSEQIPGERILAIAPHADDEVISFGGSLALHVQNGHHVKVVVCTDGRKGDIMGKYDPHLYISIREQECRRAGSVLGISDIEFWREVDGHLSQSDSFIPKLVNTIKQFNPDVIYFPGPFEFHDDHLATTQGVIQALDNVTIDPVLLMGEIIELMIYNLLVVVDSVYDTKKRALKCYTSQLKYMDIDVINEGVNHTRTANFLQNYRYVEAFIKTNRKQVAKIVDTIYSMRKTLLNR